MSKPSFCKSKIFHCIDDIMSSKTRKRMNKKSHTGRYYGGVGGDQSGASGDGGMGENTNEKGALILELLNGAISGVYTPNTLNPVRANTASMRWNEYSTPSDARYDDVDDELPFGQKPEYEEEAEQTAAKIDLARGIFQSMIGNPNVTRRDIINAMTQRAGVTDSTAVSYYERIAKEAGLTNQERGAPPPILGPGGGAGGVATRMGGGGGGAQDGSMGAGMMGMGDDEMGMEGDGEEQDLEHTFPGDPNRQGIIRQVDAAHLIYKRQVEDGTFEELWIYNVTPEMDNELEIRRAILAGTDIPPSKTKSNDGSQSYTLTTMGNAQYVHIKGLAN